MSLRGQPDITPKMFRLVWGPASSPGAGGGLWGGKSLSNTGDFQGQVKICGAGAANSQNGFAGPLISPTGFPPPSAQGILTFAGTVDTTAHVLLKMTVASASTTEQVTLKSWVVEHLRQ